MQRSRSVCDALEAAAALLVHVYDQGPSLDVPRAPKVPLALQETASDKVDISDDHGASRQSRAAPSRAGWTPAATFRRRPRASAALPTRLVSFFLSPTTVLWRICNRHVGCILTRKAVASGPGRSGAPPKRRHPLRPMCRWLGTDVVDVCGSKEERVSQVILGICAETQAAGRDALALVDGGAELMKCE